MKNTKNKTRLILSIILLLLLGFIYLFRIESSFFLNSDFGRDIFEIQKIINGDLTLIGPRLSFGVVSNPLYYYFFAPFLTISHQAPISIVYANAVIFVLSFSILFYLLTKKHNIFDSFLFIFGTAILPLSIYSGRNPGNALSYIPFFIILVCMPKLINKPSKTTLLLFGILSLICLSFHPVTLFGIIPLIAWLIITFRKKLAQLIYYIVPTVLVILPITLFEIRHNFIISKNIGNLASSAKLLPYDNLIFLNKTITNNFSSYILLLVIPALIFFVIFFKKYTSYEKIFSFWTVFLYVVLIFILPKHEGSYLIPFNIMLAVFLYIAFTKTKPSVIYFLSLIILIALNFPISLYSLTKRPISSFEKISSSVADKFPNLASDKFNIIQVSDPNILVPVGHEIRFFLTKHGLIPLPPTNFSDASTLIIFSEIGEIDIKKIDNWEINQFGKKFSIEQLQNIENWNIYVLTK